MPVRRKPAIEHCRQRARRAGRSRRRGRLVQRRRISLRRCQF